MYFSCINLCDILPPPRPRHSHMHCLPTMPLAHATAVRVLSTRTLGTKFSTEENIGYPTNTSEIVLTDLYYILPFKSNTIHG